MSVTRLQEKLRKGWEGSHLLSALRQLGKARSRFHAGRALSLEERERLERQGNSCDDWGRVRVGRGFDVRGLRGSHFSGDIYLNGFHGQVEGPDGMGLPAGVRGSHLHNCIVGNAALHDVGFAGNLLIDHQACLFRVGRIQCQGPTAFGVGRAIHPGAETGARRLWLWDGMDLEYCRECLALGAEGQAAVEKAWAACLEGATGSLGFVAEHARLSGVGEVVDAWIGPYARLDGAARVRASILLSAKDEPVEVGAGAQVEESLLQPGSFVRSGAQVRRSALLEHSGAEILGLVAESVLGPNTHIAKGEVTASLVGPFVGMHHQSLLISALWPEGRGNIGYGAKVGSNHTGKKPDQEIRPGEGMFFGLGCAVKFPADFSGAPYSLVATGLVLPPQKVSFPFSLITQAASPRPGLPPALNAILPAWTWRENAYALFRNRRKFRDRDRARRHSFDHELFRDDLAARALDAFQRLSAARAGDAPLLEGNVPGLGANFLAPEGLDKAREGYRDFLSLYLLWLYADASGQPRKWDVARKVEKALGAGGPGDFARAERGRLDALAARVRASLEREARKGSAVLDDYAAFHPAPDADPVVRALESELAEWGARLSRL